MQQHPPDSSCASFQTSVPAFVIWPIHQQSYAFPKSLCLHHRVAGPGSQTLSGYDDAHGYTSLQNSLPGHAPCHLKGLARQLLWEPAN